jgi:hypothetical protein
MNEMTMLGMQAMQLDMAYDQELVATQAGRRSYSLRREAEQLDAMGNREAAMERLREALAEFSEHDDGAAAAAACHDLANKLSDGRDRTRLESAEALYRRALRSPSRARVPRRYAETENSLGLCLRRLARKARGDERKRLLDEAETLYRGAIQRLEKIGLFGWETLANVHLNLGNLLWLERKQMEPALREYASAAKVARAVLEKVREASDEPRLSTRTSFNMAYLTSAAMLRLRGGKQDMARAEQFVSRVLEAKDPRFEPLGWLELAELALAGKAPDRHARARSLLGRIQPRQLEERFLLRLADALRRARAFKESLALLRGCIALGIHYRAVTAIADFDADSASESFQEAAAMAARIEARDLQQPLASFLTLENASGLRFSESLSSMSWSPKTVFLRELYERLSNLMGQTWQLAGFAGVLERLDPDGQRRHLDTVFEGLSRLPAHEVREDIVKHLKVAHATPVPVHHLQRVIDEGREHVVRLRSSLMEKDEGYRAAHALLQRELSETDLELLLREEPGLVLARLSLDQDLLVVTAWLEGGKLESRSTTLRVEPGLLQLLSQATVPASQVDFERLSMLLARLDISGTFPPGPRQRLVLLPSYRAAMLPLGALGPQGSRPMERFDSIVWLPCLFPLRTRQAPHLPRAGQLVVVPETTQFHGLALLESLPGERRLMGSDATPRAVERALTEVDTLAIYAHGMHEWGSSPSLGLHGGELNFLLFGKKVLQGIERVELWACESGTHRPVDPLTKPADDAYGLDFELLMRGVRSAIGTLWKVPDLVTAAIVRHYRQRLQAGRNAASALADAQRWWDAEGLPLLVRLLRERPLQNAIAAFSDSLGCEVVPGDSSSLLGSLAPVPGQLEDAQLRLLSARFACPVSWAGLRFVGLPERRPLCPWSPLEMRPLSPEERHEVERLAIPEVR